jgi:fused signal recognition particle receptor
VTQVLVALAAVLVVAAIVILMVRRRPPAARRDAPTVTVSQPRFGLGERLAAVFGAAPDAATWAALEESLLAADVGVAATTALVTAVRRREVRDAAAARRVLREEMVAVFAGTDRTLHLVGDPAVVVVVGVNGSGKTTTIAKLAARWQAAGRRVLLGGADTFRAAAVDQLRNWAERVGVEVVAGAAGADPAAVAHDARSAARARGCDVLIVDTAGRLHDKRNLMDELGKVVRVLGRDGGPVSEVLLVIDGTTGQNGLAQARAFAAAVGVTGVVVAKLDGTSRGGIALAIEHELGIPIKLIGLGESTGDLRDFDPGGFVDSLLEGW